MSAIQPVLQFTEDKIQAHRNGKRLQIQHYFENHLGEKLSSRAAHMRWGSSFRTRVSDINLDKDSPITIKNKVEFTEGMEQSAYWAVRR